MRIVVVGATGTVGKAVVAALEARHEIVPVGHSRGEERVDMADAASIRALFRRVGRFDALVAAAGRAHFGAFAEAGEAEMMLGLRHKVMGQVNLVLIGREHIADEGSFTLTSGILGRDPIPLGAGASMANGAIEAFVRAAAIVLPRGIRINAVSPGLLAESAAAMGSFFPGHEPVPGARVGIAYVKSVEGRLTGQVFQVG